jgi:hypothetical protein
MKVTETGVRLWQAVGEDWRARWPITVESSLLLDALKEIHALTARVESAERRATQAASDALAAQHGFGGCQVDLARLRYRLAAALEIAEDRGAYISDGEVDEHIAATRQVKGD